MARKRAADFLPKGTPLPEIPSFGTGEVAEILDVPIWRLQKFLDSPSYRLSSEGRLGHGRGSRRVFSTEDIYRIAIAVRMVGDGFSAAVVGPFLQEIEDRNFWSRRDAVGNELPPPAMIGLKRGPNGPQLTHYDALNVPTFGGKNSPYYLLDLDEITTEINRRIAKRTEGK